MKTLYRRPVILLFAVIGFFAMSINSCEQLLSVPMSEAEVASGLREALTIGAVNAVLATNKENGYFGNNAIKIPFPPEAAGAMQYMQNSALLRPLLNEFVLRLNRAAENAAVHAKPIFTNAIRDISIQDAWGILRGGQNAATNYLHDRTYSQLYNAFKPDIISSLNNVGAQSAWQELTTAYNTIATLSPNLNNVNTDLADYATNKALDGLFHLLAEEEAKIRRDPAARVTELLKRVFAQQ
ncbi:MAG: DUF4197 domain-containing protein [Bacteroides sp.]|jgi:hypothetical protein|nr:DUF4197 domain-containing protein [Bacteroides sp.]